MKIIAISGKARSGKETLALFIKEKLEENNNRVLITHYADLLKYICMTFFGWDGVKTERGRTLLQYVGTDVIRNKYPDFWVDFISKFLSCFPTYWDYVLIPDARFPNEISKLKEDGYNVCHIKVIRPDFESPLTKKQQEHISENAMKKIPADFTVRNKGTLDDLRAAVNKLNLEDFNGRK